MYCLEVHITTFPRSRDAVLASLPTSTRVAHAYLDVGSTVGLLTIEGLTVAQLHWLAMEHKASLYSFEESHNGHYVATFEDAEYTKEADWLKQQYSRRQVSSL